MPQNLPSYEHKYATFQAIPHISSCLELNQQEVQCFPRNPSYLLIAFSKILRIVTTNLYKSPNPNQNVFSWDREAERWKEPGSLNTSMSHSVLNSRTLDYPLGGTNDPFLFVRFFYCLLSTTFLTGSALNDSMCSFIPETFPFQKGAAWAGGFSSTWSQQKPGCVGISAAHQCVSRPGSGPESVCHTAFLT